MEDELDIMFEHVFDVNSSADPDLAGGGPSDNLDPAGAGRRDDPKPVEDTAEQKHYIARLKRELAQ